MNVVDGRAVVIAHPFGTIMRIMITSCVDRSGAAPHSIEGYADVRHSLFVAGGMMGVTVSIFLYLMLFLPWFRGYVPNVGGNE